MMLDFVFLKQVEEDKFSRRYYASSYTGGILLKCTTLYKNSISETLTNIPMAEVFETAENTYDIRMVNFALGQVGVDMGFDFGDNPQ
jgi:hypothetical protein